MKFDKTITLGNLLSIAAVFVAMLTAWANLNQKVAVIAQAQAQIVESRVTQQVVTKESIALVREDIRRIESKVDRLIERQR